MDAELKPYLEGMESRLREHAESVETKLLRSFWDWARTADARYRQHRAEVSVLDERVRIVEDRVAELERKNRGTEVRARPRMNRERAPAV